MSIRNLRDILEALAEASQREKDVHALTEFARIALQAPDQPRDRRPTASCMQCCCEPALEDLLRQSVRVSNGVAQLALEPETAQRVSEAIVKAIGAAPPERRGAPPIDMRWHVRQA